MLLLVRYPCGYKPFRVSVTAKKRPRITGFRKQPLQLIIAEWIYSQVRSARGWIEQ